MTNVLFICSRNQWRSPTAEQVWRKLPGLSVRSAGTSPRARHTVTAQDLQWADHIFVMESKHKNRLKAQFGRILSHKLVHVMNIPDEYQYMDPELVEMFEAEAEAFLASGD